MDKVIDPALAQSVLEVLPIIGVLPSDVWAEVTSIVVQSGELAVAIQVRLVMNDMLLVRHVSAVGALETLSVARQRVAASLEYSGLRSVDIVEGIIDPDEPFHTQESVREVLAMSAKIETPLLH